MISPRNLGEKRVFIFFSSDYCSLKSLTKRDQNMIVKGLKQKDLREASCCRDHDKLRPNRPPGLNPDFHPFK